MKSELEPDDHKNKLSIKVFPLDEPGKFSSQHQLKFETLFLICFMNFGMNNIVFNTLLSLRRGSNILAKVFHSNAKI